MVKELLKQTQPIVYATLDNALKNHSLGHAYIFVGPKGTPKYETAVLLAQSMVCDQEGLACEECELCERIAGGNFADLHILDAAKTKVGKEEMDDLQEKFAYTPLEKYGVKMFIVDHADAVTISGWQSILKFIEDPVGHTLGIFVCENEKQLLPTILSRCQVIHFTTAPRDYYFKEAMQKGVSEEDAYLLSHYVRETDELVKISESDVYHVACAMAQSFLDHFDREPEQFFIEYTTALSKTLTKDKDGKEKLKDIDRDKMSESLKWMFDILHVWLSDMQKGTCPVGGWYEKTMAYFAGKALPISELMRLCLEMRRMCGKVYSPQQVIDQFVCQVNNLMKR